jgi:hypothetical protein
MRFAMGASIQCPPAMQNLVAVGFLVIVGEPFTFYTIRIYEEWINIPLGV